MTKKLAGKQNQTGSKPNETFQNLNFDMFKNFRPKIAFFDKFPRF